jgi:hypothetical protein
MAMVMPDLAGAASGLPPVRISGAPCTPVVQVHNAQRDGGGGDRVALTENTAAALSGP